MTKFRAAALLAATALTALAALPAAAQSRDPLAGRGGELPAVLSWLQNQGVKLTSLGNEGGVAAYLGESANGRMQTFYVTPDGRNVVAGVMFEAGGKNVTGVQIGEMRKRFEAASAGVASETVGDGAEAPAGTQAPSDGDGGAAPDEAPAVVDALSGDDAAAGSADETPTAGQEGAEAPVETSEPQPEAALEAPALPEVPVVPAAVASALPAVPPPAGPVDGAMGNAAEVWISSIDKGKFLEAAGKAPYFEVGALSARNVLWMVADPKCPHCHAAWDRIEQLVYSKRLRVRVIMIAGLEGSEPFARELLSRGVPARAWLDSDAGRNLELTTPEDSPEWAKAGGFLEQNTALAAEFGIDRTPFLAYEGLGGHFYAALGSPSDMDAFLSALDPK